MDQLRILDDPKILSLLKKNLCLNEKTSGQTLLLVQ